MAGTTRNIQVALQFVKGESELAFLKQLFDKPSVPVNLNVSGVEKLTAASQSITSLTEAIQQLEKNISIKINLPGDSVFSKLKELTSTFRELSDVAGKLQNVNLSNLRLTTSQLEPLRNAVEATRNPVAFRSGQLPANYVSSGGSSGLILAGRIPPPRSYNSADSLTANYDESKAPIPLGPRVLGPYSPLCL